MYIVLDENNYIRATSTSELGNSIELDLPDDFDYEYQGCYKVIDNEFIFDNGKKIDYDLNPLRAERIKILQAFDIYKTNVLYGIEEETNKEEILEWYRNILDLVPNSFENIPNKIRKYI